jgi:DNA-binding HxlR family transcriptional regulator
MAAPMKLTTEVVEQAQLLSSPVRVLILSLLKSSGLRSWSELEQSLSGALGEINPNTLHFHLKLLVNAGWVVRSGNGRRVTYALGDIPASIDSLIPRAEVSVRGKK